MKEVKKKSIQTSPEKSKEKIPWTFGLAVKDLTNPIVLKRIRLLEIGVIVLILGGFGYYTWENFLRAPTGTELVNEMIAAAGGMEAWNNIGSGQFTRTQNVYDETGQPLSNQVETFFFKKTKDGWKLMVKAIDKEGKEIIISEDDEGFWATKEKLPANPRKSSGDLGMMCDSKFCTPSCASSMAMYRFGMPFKLRDYGVESAVNNITAFGLLDWNPLENIDLESEPLVLDVSYDPEVGKDKWRFLVNPETKLIHKMEYYNKSDFGQFRPEEIYWSDHKTVDGITFSHRWTRFWGNGKVMDEYIYSDVAFNHIDDTYFERPDGHVLASD